MIYINQEICEGCGDCAALCPHDCIGMESVQGRTVPHAEPEDCTDCGVCVSTCPNGAIITDHRALYLAGEVLDE